MKNVQLKQDVKDRLTATVTELASLLADASTTADSLTVPLTKIVLYSSAALVLEHEGEAMTDIVDASPELQEVVEWLNNNEPEYD